MSCNGICHLYRAKIDGVLRARGMGAYMQGFRRCNTCNIFLTDEGIVSNKKGNQFCRCCNFRVTTKPKLKKTRLKLASLRKEEEERPVLYGFLL